MAIQSYKMGPGTLKFDTGLSQVVSAQVASCEVECEENVDTSDAVDVLTGERLEGDETITFTWTLSATVIQDLASAGFVTWSWTNAGQAKGFEFVPSTAVGRKVTGTVMVVPIKIGGQSKTRPKSDLSWRNQTGTTFALAAAV